MQTINVMVHTHTQCGINAPQIDLELLNLPEFDGQNEVEYAPGGYELCNFRQMFQTLDACSLKAPRGTCKVKIHGPRTTLRNRFELPLAIAMLVASGELTDGQKAGYEFYGDLALDGKINPVRGLLSMLMHDRYPSRINFVPEAQRDEVQLATGLTVIFVRHLCQIHAHLTGKSRLPVVKITDPAPSTPTQPLEAQALQIPESVRQAMVLALAGAHPLLLLTAQNELAAQLARTMNALLPALNHQAAYEVNAIAALLRSDHRYGPSDMDSRNAERFELLHRFQRHHHHAPLLCLSDETRPHELMVHHLERPALLNRAHGGILLLQNVQRFDYETLEKVTAACDQKKIYCTQDKAFFPAQFLMVASMVPCACDHVVSRQPCRCSLQRLIDHRRTVPANFLEKFPLQLPFTESELPQDAALQIPADPVELAKRIAQVRIQQLDAYIGRRELLGLPDPNEDKERFDADCRALLAEKAQRERWSFALSNAVAEVAFTAACWRGQSSVTIADLKLAFAMHRTDL